MCPAKSRPLLLLIDASHALFRAYFAVRGLRSPSGQPTGGVYGFTSMLLKLIDEHAPDSVAVCFDGPGHGFRAEIDPQYKANRPPTPEDLKIQWPWALRVANELGLCVLEDESLEADDLIATLAVRGRAAGMDVLVVSGDKDLMQLVVDPADGLGAVRQLDDGKGALFDEAGVAEKWGVPAHLIGDLLAIMGDSVDNIPGVKGIGKKGAVTLLRRFGSLDAIFAGIDEIERERTRKLLREGEPAARLARRLVALECDGDVGVTLDELTPQTADKEALTQSFGDLGFKRLLRRYFSAGEQGLAKVQVDVIRQHELVVREVEALRAAGRVAIDVVLSGSDGARRTPMRGAILAIGAASSVGRAVIFPRQQTLDGPVHPALRALLEDPEVAIVGHDLKYTLVTLLQNGIKVAGLAADPMLASYLCESGGGGHGLSQIALERLSYKMASYEELFGKGRSLVAHENVELEVLARYVGERAALAWAAADLLLVAADEHGVRHLHDELELPLTEVMAHMEQVGVRLDVAELGRQSASLGERLDALETTIHGHAGTAFNINSPKQLGVVLFESLGLPAKRKTKTGWSTNQAALEALREAHPIINEVFAYRQLGKLKSTYTDALPGLVHPRTGRVHTSFNQAVAATGRLSSTDPNLQNIPIRTPEGRRVRLAFVAAPGHLLLSADYSQVELRVMAHMADEPGMLDAFRNDVDIHRQTAAEIFKLPIDEVSGSQRSTAKTINFGVLYGMGSTRLAAEIGVSRKEAKAFIGRYFERFVGVRGFMDRTLEEARERREVRTLYGRRRPVGDIASSNHMHKAAAERIAVNTPVQGTAADLIKRAMLIVARRLAEAGLSARMLLQVHDELLFEVPEAEVQATTELVRQAMADAGELKVPLKVEVGVGDNWAQAH